MSRTYLDLCRLLVSELGVAGGSGPATVTGQVAELRNIVQWVAEADVYIQNLWTDWDFLWAKAENAYVPEGESTIRSISDLNLPLPDGMVLEAGSDRAYSPTYLPWPEFRQRYTLKPKRTGRVSAWAMRPDGVIELSHTMAANTYWSLEYYRKAKRMAANGDRSPIPEQFDRVIIARAAVIYGTREDAPEIVSGYAAEYDDVIEKMQNQLLTAFRAHATAGQAATPEPDWSGL